MKSVVDNRGRPKGQKKTGGRKSDSIIVHSNEVKAAVLRVFNEVNASDDYLRDVAENDKRLFLSLLARMIPQESAVQMNVAPSVSLGDAMREAQARLDQYQRDLPVVEHVPVATVPSAAPAQHDDRVPSDVRPIPKNQWPGY